MGVLGRRWKGSEIIFVEELPHKVLNYKNQKPNLSDLSQRGEEEYQEAPKIDRKGSGQMSKETCDLSHSQAPAIGAAW